MLFGCNRVKKIFPSIPISIRPPSGIDEDIYTPTFPDAVKVYFGF
jgi:hypothetical protein